MVDKPYIRVKAIALFNLITACRTSEMVVIQVKRIDLKNRTVNVYLKKKKERSTNRLTLEVVNAIKEHINTYDLELESYLVGKVDKYNDCTTIQVSDVAYRRSIHKWLHTILKTRVSAMHEAGASPATNAKQSGHKNFETISKHYLSVNDKTIEKHF
ncbi:tyrosine-type recombinase/integrase [Psychrobacillus psychrodurans]|uniref:tyrosine-type recombinase/integrase n=1 Tax=Psychrobacillus psychrodurans TaxID=126157 RepID=UPI003D05B7B4